MKCPKCNCDNLNNCKFCQNCGNNLQEVNNGSSLSISSINPTLNQQNFNHFEEPINQNNNIRNMVQGPVNYNYIQNITDDYKPKKKSKLVPIIIIIVLALIAVGCYFFFNKSNKKEEINMLDTTETAIWQDYNSGKITADEYVKNILYAMYNDDSLDSKYKKHNDSYIDMNRLTNFIEEHIDEIDKETLKYYFDKIYLVDVTFDADVENDEPNESSFLDLFVDKVYAKNNKTNLNKALLSKKGNFIVWYTETGESKITKEYAQKIADGLEKTTQKYKELSGYDFKYDPNISKGLLYKNQQNILTINGIDKKYLDTALSVYIAENNGDNLAVYLQKTSPVLMVAYNKIYDTDVHSVATPYIIIKPSSFDNYETLEQLYNHELFHHYQGEILCGHFDCKCGKDPFISEATAQWGSSFATDKTTTDGFLNNWAGTAVKYSDNFLSEELFRKYGKERMSYALFVYLNSYSEIVPTGSEIIIYAIYKDDAMSYLYDHASISNLIAIQKNIALKNLSQDYDNKNLIYNSKSFDLKISEEIGKNNKDKKTYLNKSLSPVGIRYYKIEKGSKEYRIALTKGEKTENEHVSLYLIAEKNGKYEIVGETGNSKEKQYIFNTNDYKYDNLYVAVTNNTPHKTVTYTLTMEPVEQEKQNNNANNNENNNSSNENDLIYQFILQDKYDLTETTLTLNFTVKNNVIDVVITSDVKYPEYADGPLPKPYESFTISDSFFVETMKEVLKIWKEERDPWDGYSIIIAFEHTQNRYDNLCEVMGNFYCDMFAKYEDTNHDGKITLEEDFIYNVNDFDPSILH